MRLYSSACDLFVSLKPKVCTDRKCPSLAVTTCSAGGQLHCWSVYRAQPDFTVFPCTHFPAAALRSLLGTCFASNSNLSMISTLVQNVNNCTDFNTPHTCCYDAADNEVRPVKHLSTLHKPAQLCSRRGQQPAAATFSAFAMLDSTASQGSTPLLMHVSWYDASVCTWHKMLGLYLLCVRTLSACFHVCIMQPHPERLAAAWLAACLQVSEYVNTGHRL